MYERNSHESIFDSLKKKPIGFIAKRMNIQYLNFQPGMSMPIIYIPHAYNV